MFSTIIAGILVVLWAIALFSSATFGGWIHLLPGLALFIFFFAIYRDAQKGNRLTM